jgi:starvation-inducible DNA-binding protein
MKEPDFHDYHPLLDEQAEQIFATTDDVEASAQGRWNSLRSISNTSQHQSLKNNNEEVVAPNEDE